MDENWIVQDDGSYLQKNRWGSFTVDAEGRLLAYEWPDHTPTEDKQPKLWELILPEGITEIGTIARECRRDDKPFFQNMQVREKLVFPETLRLLGDHEFAWCTLPELVFPPHLQSMGDGAFVQTSTPEILFNAELKSMGNACFLGVKTDAVILPEGMGEVQAGGRAFKDAEIGCLLLPASATASYRMLFMEARIHRVVKYTQMATNDGNMGCHCGMRLIDSLENPSRSMSAKQ